MYSVPPTGRRTLLFGIDQSIPVRKLQVMN